MSCFTLFIYKNNKSRGGPQGTHLFATTQFWTVHNTLSYYSYTPKSCQFNFTMHTYTSSIITLNLPLINNVHQTLYPYNSIFISLMLPCLKLGLHLFWINKTNIAVINMYETLSPSISYIILSSLLPNDTHPKS